MKIERKRQQIELTSSIFGEMYRIRDDKLNLIPERRSDKPDKYGDYTWTVLGYFSSINKAISAIIRDGMVENHDTMDLAEYLGKYANEFEDLMKQILPWKKVN